MISFITSYCFYWQLELQIYLRKTKMHSYKLRPLTIELFTALRQKFDRVYFM